MAGVSTILVVDDDGDIRHFLSELLESEGYCVRSAADGREALATLRHADEPCIVLLDLMMPVCDGEEVMREVERDESMRGHSKIVVMSASDLLAQRAFPIATALLPKPFDLYKLLDLLEMLSIEPPASTGSMSAHQLEYHQAS